MTVRVDRLPEVALPIEQPDRDERESHVARRFGVVAGEDAEAAGIDPERLVEAVLGAEIGNGAVQGVRISALEPVVGAVRHVGVELAHHGLVFGHERWVIQEIRPGHGAGQHRHGIAIAGPGSGVDPREQHLGPRMPRPVQVVRQASQSFEGWREAELIARKGRDLNGWLHVAGMIGRVVRRRGIGAKH